MGDSNVKEGNVGKCLIKNPCPELSLPELKEIIEIQRSEIEKQGFNIEMRVDKIILRFGF